MKKIISLLFTIVIFLCFGALKGNAQIKQSITVYPAIIDLDVTSGQTYEFSIQFLNLDDKPISGVIKKADFTVKDKEGNPILIEDEEVKPVFAASNWISTNTERITIPANDFITVYFSAHIPHQSKTCGNYAFVYFENESPMASSASVLTTKIGSLVNFTIKDKVCKEEIKISNLKYPVFSEYGPVKITFEIINQGDYHIAPNGTVSLTNIFNKQIAGQMIPKKRIFPGALKEYEMNLGRKWMFGLYNLTINLPEATTVHLWVFPWKLIVIITLAIILIVIKVIR